MDSAIASLQALSPQAACASMVLLVAACTVTQVIPTTPLNFAAGIICGGFLPGSICFNLGATLGSAINFVLGRHCFRNWARRKMDDSPTLAALEGAIAKRAAGMIVLARLSPVFPFAVVGVVLGATNVDFFTFCWATAVGLTPGVCLYTSIGLSVQATASGDGNDGWSSYISIVAGVVSTVLISWQAKKVFDEATSKTKASI